MQKILAGLAGFAFLSIASLALTHGASATPAENGALARAPKTSAKLVQKAGYSWYGSYHRNWYYSHPYSHRYCQRPGYEHYSCAYWYDRCVENWGYYEPDIIGCLRYQGCYPY